MAVGRDERTVNVVISQSMYFPWVGFLEQIALSDVFVRYDDVQFSKGSFTNRVQIKTPAGIRWMSVPLKDLHLGQRICEVQLPPDNLWREQHIGKLAHAYGNAPHRDEMLALATSVLYSSEDQNLGDLAFKSTYALAQYFGLSDRVQWRNVSAMSIGGSGSARVLEVVKSVGGTRYITGHGARHYLDHEAFEAAGVEVRYMQYSCKAYPQLHGEFTPFVSALDLAANLGRRGEFFMKSHTTHWREFLNET